MGNLHADVAVLEVDRNARAYGFEIGRGKPMTEVLEASPDNPFLDIDWRIKAGLPED